MIKCFNLDRRPRMSDFSIVDIFEDIDIQKPDMDESVFCINSNGEIIGVSVFIGEKFKVSVYDSVSSSPAEYKVFRELLNNLNEALPEYLRYFERGSKVFLVIPDMGEDMENYEILIEELIRVSVMLSKIYPESPEKIRENLRCYAEFAISYYEDSEIIEEDEY